jgi:hypothetical protein
MSHPGKIERALLILLCVVGFPFMLWAAGPDAWHLWKIGKWYDKGFAVAAMVALTWRYPAGLVAMVLLDGDKWKTTDRNQPIRLLMRACRPQRKLLPPSDQASAQADGQDFARVAPSRDAVDAPEAGRCPMSKSRGKTWRILMTLAVFVGFLFMLFAAGPYAWNLWRAGEWYYKLFAAAGMLALGWTFPAAMIKLLTDYQEPWKKKTDRNQPNLLSMSACRPQRKLLPPSEQASDRPEDKKRLQDGQKQE